MTTFQPIDWYDTPLYYDIVFDDYTRPESEFLAAVLKRHGKTRGRKVLEPACGSGRLVAAMASRGFSVTGFDKNEIMLRYAKKRLRTRKLKADLFQGRLERFSVKDKFDLAHCFVSTFRYILTEKGARSHLRCVRDTLKPGGLYVLGIHLSNYDTDRCSRERWDRKRKGVHVTCNIHGWPADPKKRVERHRCRMVVSRNGKVHQQENIWDFRAYNAKQLKATLRSVPELEHIASYDMTYDIDNPQKLCDDQLDYVLVLRRKSGARGE
jgi:SAM-dependent methyltransferase